MCATFLGFLICQLSAGVCACSSTTSDEAKRLGTSSIKRSLLSCKIRLIRATLWLLGPRATRSLSLMATPRLFASMDRFVPDTNELSVVSWNQLLPSSVDGWWLYKQVRNLAFICAHKYFSRFTRRSTAPLRLKIRGLVSTVRGCLRLAF